MRLPRGSRACSELQRKPSAEPLCARWSGTQAASGAERVSQYGPPSGELGVRLTKRTSTETRIISSMTATKSTRGRKPASRRGRPKASSEASTAAIAPRPSAQPRASRWYCAASRFTTPNGVAPSQSCAITLARQARARARTSPWMICLTRIVQCSAQPLRRRGRVGPRRRREVGGNVERARLALRELLGPDLDASCRRRLGERVLRTRGREQLRQERVARRHAQRLAREHEGDLRARAAAAPRGRLLELATHARGERVARA